MYSRLLLASLWLTLSLVLINGNARAVAAEKIKIALAQKVSPHYSLPASAAEEKGFWKENGLEVELVPFDGGGPTYRALASGRIDMVLGSSSAFFQAVAGGVPVMIVSDLYWPGDFFIYVNEKSKIKESKDLKGAKIGVSVFGGVLHAYARVVVTKLGLEKDTKIVATGGSRQAVAALRTGAVDAICLSIYQLINLKLQGEVRELVSLADYLPTEWSEHVVSAHKEFARRNPETLKRAVKVIIQSTDFIRNNPRWTMDQLKETQGYSEEAAKIIYEQYSRRSFTEDGKIRKKGLENVKNFLIEFGIIPKEKVPPASEMYWEAGA